MVAPLAGAWIETDADLQFIGADIVAPLAGAWIETGNSELLPFHVLVAPLAGAWIETTLTSRKDAGTTRRAPRGRVD